MKNFFSITAIILLMSTAGRAQTSQAGAATQMPATAIPHQFKEVRTGATIEAVRTRGTVKIYLLVDDIEQYSELQIDRTNDIQGNFGQCKVISVEKGKYKNNYVEVVDQYPLPPAMTVRYRLKAINSEGSVKMFPPVSVAPEETAKQ